MKRLIRLFIVLVPSIVIGCGSGQFETAEVTGRITWNGQPVTGGQLQFSPHSPGSNEPGKPGAATIRPDGTFSVSTYDEEDGAVVGTHTVTYIAPPPRPQNESTSQSSGQPSNDGPTIRSPYEGLVTSQATIEVSEEDTVLELQLVRPNRQRLTRSGR